MAPFTTSLAAFFIIAPLLAFSAPQTSYLTHSNRDSDTSPAYIQADAGLPGNTTHLAIDDETGEVIAFGRHGEQLGRFAFAPHTTKRQAIGACADMSSDDVQKCNVPGWNTLKTTAENNWGTGSYNVVTNDKSVRNPSASQSCTTKSSQSSGSHAGADGTISLTHSEGTSSSTTTTVTEESSIAAGVSVAATVKFPEIVDVTTSFTFTSTFTNTLSTAMETKSDQTSSATVTQNNVAGKTCYLEFTTQSCTITGSGEVRMLGTGWVWFEYNDQTKGHYKWALSIDDTLSNQDDRSTFIDFSSTTGTTSTSNYTGVCA
ncbi:hypothetical protein B0H12DRAFT_1203701 [Mycena haematopus]|nr:hypothetical protein B0H12DRAFT_1203701 [Mycena haematopus]